MNLTYLREFITFAKSANFTAAAKALYISQPTLSNHIAALEKEIGADLVVHGSRVMLTAAGRELLKAAPDLILHCEEVMRECQEASQADRYLSIACTRSGSCCDDNLDTLITSFIYANRQIYVDSVAARKTSESAYDLLKDGEVDAVFVQYQPLKEDIERGVCFATVPNYHDGQLCLYLDRSNPLAQIDVLEWDKIGYLSHPINTELSPLMSHAIMALLEAKGIEVRSRLITNRGWNSLTSLERDEVYLLDNGYATSTKHIIELTPERMLKPIEGPDSTAECYLAYLSDNPNTALAALLDFAQSERAALEGRRAAKDAPTA